MTVMLKTFLIPVCWEAYGMVRVEAESIEDAVRYVNGHECLMPEGYYVEDSLNVDYEMIEEEAKSHA